MSNYQLTELFPHIDNEIISYVYKQADGDIEKSINLLLKIIKDTNDKKDLEKINAEIQRIEENSKKEDNIEEKIDDNKMIKEITEQHDRQIAQELHDEILSRTIQDIMMFDHENQQKLENKKSSKKEKNKVNFMTKFGKKFKELFSKMSCSCYSDINHPSRYHNMEDNLLDNIPEQEYNINSYIDDMPNSDDSKNSPRSISPTDIMLIENEPIEIRDISKI